MLNKTMCFIKVNLCEVVGVRKTNTRDQVCGDVCFVFVVLLTFRSKRVTPKVVAHKCSVI